MGKSRLEAFSDGVIAIIITIMVLELKVPEGAELKNIAPLVPMFLCYVLSFVYVGIYWNNHHHMLHAVKKVDGCSLWANMHLLFWLSLVPFCTGWMGENHFSKIPVAVYGFVLFMAGLAYFILSKSLAKNHEENAVLKKAVGDDRKEKMSLILYAISVPIAFLSTWISIGIYILVAVMWFVPDRRIEKQI